MRGIFKPGNTAVISGGASGIGLALAKKCLGYNMKVLVVDRNAAQLDALSGQNIHTYAMDVANIDHWDRLRTKIENDFDGQINLLALNAGVGLETSFNQSDRSNLASFKTMMDVNVFGVINGITALLQLMRTKSTEENPSAIVVTGSKQGITNPPSNPGYNASKAAVKTLAEHLSFDLKGTPINVHLLIPGWTWTNMTADTSHISKKPAAQWMPEQVVDYLEKRIEEKQFWVICPDNETTEEMDRKRILWGAGDLVHGRPPLSRWRDEYRDDVSKWMQSDGQQ